jgi:hypothetical protein
MEANASCLHNLSRHILQGIDHLLPSGQNYASYDTGSATSALPTNVPP